MGAPSAAEADAAHLAERLGAWSGQVIESELSRLTRRVPDLSGAELAVLDDILRRVVDRLLLDPVRAASPRQITGVAPVFEHVGQ